MSAPLVTLGIGGFVLFTLGLLVGIFISMLRNSRMGLSAHLTAVQTGPALIVFALFWQYFSIPDVWTPWLSYALLISAYVLAAGILLAAFFGASDALPMAGEGFSASRMQEMLVSFMVRGSSLVMLAACVIICYFALLRNGP